MTCHARQIRDIIIRLRVLGLLLECVNSQVCPGKKSRFPDDVGARCAIIWRISQMGGHIAVSLRGVEMN